MISALEFEERRDTGFLVAFCAAVVASVFLHYGFYFWASGYEVKSLSPKTFDELVPRKVQLRRVEIDQTLLKPEPEPGEVLMTKMVPVPVKLPKESAATGPEAEEVNLPPEVFRPNEPIHGPENLAGMPRGKNSFKDLISKEPSSVPLTDDNETTVEPVRELVLPIKMTVDAPKPGDGMVQSMPGGVKNGGDLGGTGFSDLDEMLARTGPLTPDTAPISLPGDLLFDYDSAELRTEAMGELGKLGKLILRSPDVFFLIEGHTDSFGSEEYNLGLSERRASAVKEWLVGELGISPERIRTVGMGESSLLVKEGTVEEQRLNRRVEIVIKANFRE